MKNYKEITTDFGTTIIQYEENGFLVSIPCDPANSDYQAYLNKDKAEQSTPSVTNGD
jgi:hypothetical protein